MDATRNYLNQFNERVAAARAAAEKAKREGKKK